MSVSFLRAQDLDRVSIFHQDKDCDDTVHFKNEYFLDVGVDPAFKGEARVEFVKPENQMS